jgi:hypothetical protein
MMRWQRCGILRRPEDVTDRFSDRGPDILDSEALTGAPLRIRTRAEFDFCSTCHLSFELDDTIWSYLSYMAEAPNPTSLLQWLALAVILDCVVHTHCHSIFPSPVGH